MQLKNSELEITECPRDAMQGIGEFIPTKIKAAYLQALLEVNFGVLDFGSFVSPKSIPQLRDTGEVLGMLELPAERTKLLAIIANLRGAQDASHFEQIDFLGFPFSISEEFQKRNAHSTIEESYRRVMEIQEVCIKSNKKLLIYLSMAFGNPYGELWSIDILNQHALKLQSIGVQHFALADTIGCATASSIGKIYKGMVELLGFGVNLGLHLHSTPYSSAEKIAAALDAGCCRFDTALMGFGGCPMATDILTGNIATEVLCLQADTRKIETGIKVEKWSAALGICKDIFGKFH